MTTRFVSIRSSFLTWPGAKSLNSHGMVAASFSTLSGHHYPTSKFLQTSLGLLVMEQFCCVSGSQARGFQHSLSVNRVPIIVAATFGVPYGHPNGLTFHQIVAHWWKYCALALLEPLPLCPWFAICPCW